MNPVRYTRIVRTAAVAAVAALALAGCSGGDSGTTETGPDTDGAAGSETRTLTLAESLIVQKWDPFAEDYGAFMQPLQAAYDTLVRLNPDQTYSPALATEWEYTDPSTLVLTLREGVTFSDGEPLDAAAVVTNFESGQQQVGPKTPFIAGWEVTAVDDMTVQFVTPEPNPNIPLILSTNLGMMVSPKALTEDYAGLQQVPVGAGPYVLDTSRTVQNDTYTFVRNESYWNADAIGFDEVVFKIISDQTSAFNALRSGQVDGAAGTSTLDDSAEQAGMKVYHAPSFFMGLSLQGQTLDAYPALADVRVRQAMEYAVDRDALQLTIGAGSPTTQFFAPGTEGFDPALDDAYPRDVDRAKELLADAGFPDGFTFTVTSVNQSFFPAYTQALAAQLAEAGITMQINNVQFDQYLANRNSPDNPVYVWYYNPSNAYYDGQQVLLPDGGFNPFHITDDAIVDLMGQAAQAGSPDERSDLLKQVGARFVDQAYHLITNFGDASYIVNPQVVADFEFPTIGGLPSLYDLQPAS